MKMPRLFACLKSFRFPREVFAYAVWAYYRFSMSNADVEDLLAERNIIVIRETIRLWVWRFGTHFAYCIRKDPPKPNNKWHLDKVVIAINGVKYWLWRAISVDGDIRDIVVQQCRDTKAAKRFFNKLVKQFGEPRVVVIAKLRSYIKPIKTLISDADYWTRMGLNGCIENSHGPIKKAGEKKGAFQFTPVCAAIPLQP